MITSKSKINIFLKNFFALQAPSGLLRLNFFKRKMLILAFEANSAASLKGTIFRILSHCVSSLEGTRTVWLVQHFQKELFISNAFTLLDFDRQFIDDKILQ